MNCFAFSRNFMPVCCSRYREKSKQHKGKVEITIQFGITQAKQKKYNDRLDGLISCYADPSSPDYRYDYYEAPFTDAANRVLDFTWQEFGLLWRFKRPKQWFAPGVYSVFTMFRINPTMMYFCSGVACSHSFCISSSTVFDIFSIPSPFSFQKTWSIFCATS